MSNYIIVEVETFQDKSLIEDLLNRLGLKYSVTTVDVEELQCEAEDNREELRDIKRDYEELLEEKEELEEEIKELENEIAELKNQNQ